MSKRVIWIVAIAAAGLLGTGQGPALARGSHAAHVASSGGARSSYGHSRGKPGIDFGRINRGGQRRDELRNGVPIVGWPYLPAFEEIPVGGSDVPAQPQVIVVSGGPGGSPPHAAANDYGFVAGCRAIPNGYHCEPPHHEEASPQRP